MKLERISTQAHCEHCDRRATFTLDGVPMCNSCTLDAVSLDAQWRLERVSQLGLDQ